jgi:excisionase family DNA binding protein
MPATEVATLLGLNVKSVYAGAAAGEIPCRRVGRRFLFVRSVITTWLASAPDPVPGSSSQARVARKGPRR